MAGPGGAAPGDGGLPAGAASGGGSGARGSATDGAAARARVPAGGPGAYLERAMAMRLGERLRLARATYRRAVAAARQRNAPAAWRRLVRAGQNLREVEAAAQPGARVRHPAPGRSRPRPGRR